MSQVTTEIDINKQPAAILMSEASQLACAPACMEVPQRVPAFQVNQFMGEFDAGLTEQLRTRRRSPVLLRIALIDRFCLSRDCLIEASRELVQQVEMSAFETIEDYLLADEAVFDLIVAHYHAGDVLETSLADIQRFCSGKPVIVMSDADDDKHAADALLAFDMGARGFILTRTTGIAMLSAAIHVVIAGGTFVPSELLLTKAERSPAPLPAPPSIIGLTAKQQAVLGLLRQGKANKIIAHELRMSESTVKVHVRNLLRKMGATNRTQAVYNAQKA